MQLLFSCHSVVLVRLHVSPTGHSDMMHPQKKYLAVVTFADLACYWILDSLLMPTHTGQRLG